MAETLQGDSVTVTSMDPVMINGANVVSADILTSNGVIHVIDTVLVPGADAAPGPATAPAEGYSRLVSVSFKEQGWAGDACIEVGHGEAVEYQMLMLGDCTASMGGWRYDEDTKLLRSELDDDFCMQAGYGEHEHLQNINMRLARCDEDSDVQQFVWEPASGLRLASDEHYCVVWRGVTPNIANDPIILNPCEHAADKLDWKFE